MHPIPNPTGTEKIFHPLVAQIWLDVLRDVIDDPPGVPGTLMEFLPLPSPLLSGNEVVLLAAAEAAFALVIVRLR